MARMNKNYRRGEAALAAWQAADAQPGDRHRTPDEADLRDVVTDILHLMAREGKDIESELRQARTNFDDEHEERS